MNWIIRLALRRLLGKKPEYYPARIFFIFLIFFLFNIYWKMEQHTNKFICEQNPSNCIAGEPNARESESGLITQKNAKIQLKIKFFLISFSENIEQFSSTFAILISGALAYRAFAFSKFASIHEKMYSNEIILARQIVDSSPIIDSINELDKSGVTSEEQLREWQRCYKSYTGLESNQENTRERSAFDAKDQANLFQLVNLMESVWPDFQHQPVPVNKNKAKTEVNEYYKILQFTNFLESACSDFYNQVVPYDKFRDAIGSIIQIYYPRLKTFIDHRKRLRKVSSEESTEHSHNYMYRYIEYTYRKLKKFYKNAPEKLE